MPAVTRPPRRRERKPRPWTRAELVVEVLSDGSRRYDMGIKRSAYMRWRITDYWIIDPEARTITIARRGQDDDVRSDLVRWHPAGAAEALEIDIPDLFRAAIGD